MSPKGIRPGTWSRRWTVNLVTAGEARRAVAFINQLFSIFNFKNLKFSKFSKKKIISRNCNWKCSKNIPKFEKNENWEKNSQHSYEILNFRQVQSIWESQGESCICHQSFWKFQKMSQKSKFHFFKDCRRSKSETTASQRLRISEDDSNPWVTLRKIHVSQ